MGYNNIFQREYGAVVAQRTFNPLVQGSNPCAPTNKVYYD